ncbi:MULTISPECIES: hypothetical protein [unclassified Kitasatospora]|uniref:hypothetical protein n=1 Tax=unclassified Kitasatospora TaxID=2633591 RepID=UPI00070FFD1C|nr:MULTISPECIES: hypothetical protein [unclassified Kitasatospora]KQV20916.1 hypothetical protein ASC99_20650 [Kitasatospora sp. Root107]KRB60430.1 hypothetical protein ASE03_12530 [Kitasatospora sp. Root187]
MSSTNSAPPDRRSRPDQALATFTGALAPRLPGQWTASSASLATSGARCEMDARLWDLAHASWALGEFVYDSAGLLRGPGGRELFVLPRPRPHTGQYIVAALLPEAFGSAYDHEDLAPHGIAVDPDPARAAAAISERLLPRYTQAIHQVLERINSTADLPFTSQDADSALLSNAVRTLLLVAELRVADEPSGLAEVLAGGGEYICDRFEFDYDLAPLFEAAAVQAVLAAAGVDNRSLFDPGIPHQLRRLSERSPAESCALLRRAADSLDEPPPAPRTEAARARTRLLSFTAAVTSSTPAPPITSATSAPRR